MICIVFVTVVVFLSISTHAGSGYCLSSLTYIQYMTVYLLSISLLCAFQGFQTLFAPCLLLGSQDSPVKSQRGERKLI